MRGISQRERLLSLGRCEEVVFDVMKAGAGGHHPQPVETVLVTGQEYASGMVDAAALHQEPLDLCPHIHDVFLQPRDIRVTVEHVHATRQRAKKSWRSAPGVRSGGHRCSFSWRDGRAPSPRPCRYRCALSAHVFSYPLFFCAAFRSRLVRRLLQGAGRRRPQAPRARRCRSGPVRIPGEFSSRFHWHAWSRLRPRPRPRSRSCASR